MRNPSLILIAAIVIAACQPETPPGAPDHAETAEMKFDAAKWRAEDGRDYPYRDAMLENVVYNDTIRSLTKSQIVELLGEPDRTRNNHLYYRIAQKRLAMWPLHTKSMVIKFADDDTIEWIKIHE